MAKFSKKKLVQLIENLVNKIVENKVERLVEERVQKITPMLVEHEVNRLLRENEQSRGIQQESVEPAHQSRNSNNSGNRVVDDVMEDNEDIQDKNQLRERFKSLVSGGSGANPNDIGRTVRNGGQQNSNMNFGGHQQQQQMRGGHQQQQMHGGGHQQQATPPPTTPEGKPIDTSDPAVQNVMNAINQDFSDKLKDMEERSKQRGGKLPTNG